MKTRINYFAVMIALTATPIGNHAAAQTSGPLYNEIEQQDSLQFAALTPETWIN